MHQLAEILFRCTIWRTIVVGQVEVCDAVVKGVMCYFSLTVPRGFITKIMPKTKTNLWEQNA